MHGDELVVLKDLVIVVGISVLVILLFHRFRLPSVLAFLVTGILIGPYGLSLIEATREVRIFSESGVILLLFIIGVEFSLKELVRIKGTVFWGGALQVLLTIGLIAGSVTLLGLSWQESLFMGFMFSLSSTAIVLKVLAERGEMSTPSGRVVLAILIFQDLIVVPMMLVTPLLAGQAQDIWREVMFLLLKIAGVILLFFLLASYVVPFVLQRVVRTRSRELFLLTIVAFCFGTAWLTSALGLSLALGAFFAGLMVSENPYRHQAVALILPFREIFLSFFFVSVGMLLDLRFFADHIVMVHLLALGSLVIKILVVTGVVLILKYSLKTAIKSGLALFQVGEFAFILSAIGLSEGVLSPEVYQYFLAVSIISMGATPIVMHYSGKIADRIVRLYLKGPLMKRLDSLRRVKELAFAQYEHYTDHLVIIGYGISGKTLAFASRIAGIKYIILESDHRVFEKARKNGEPIIFGDATSEEVLHHLHVPTARIVVVATGEPVSTFRIVEMVRRMSESAFIIVKAKGLSAIDKGIDLGADEVIPGDFQTSLEIFSHVLRKYMIPEEEITRSIEKIRSDHYEIFRKSPNTDLT